MTGTAKRGRLVPYANLVPAGIAAALFAFFAFRVPAIASGVVDTASIEWAPAFGLTASFRLDGLSLLFALLITGIGTVVFVYARRYLDNRTDATRISVMLLAFMASMLGLVVSDNVLLLFMFWELTSVTSYLLIGVDHEREESRKAAQQALLVTGAGGLALLAGLIMLAQIGGSWEISELIASGDVIKASSFYPLALALILLGAFTKSAQFPFHFWLPNAMVAPTPISAYLHSATMVKAGIFLLARFHPALAGTTPWFYVVTSVGAFTMLLGAWTAIRQSDLKRLLAFSTVSALGTMTMLLGIGNVAAAKAVITFLVAHAMYKGALFMASGAVDHETGTRDVTRLGGLRKLMPLTALVAALAGASMAGVPPLMGYLGKETLFAASRLSETGSLILTVVTWGSMTLTVVAAAIAGFGPYFGAVEKTPKVPHEAPMALWAGPLLLAIIGVLLGLAPQATSTWLVGPAASQIQEGAGKVALKLWPGLTLILGMSASALLLGILIHRYLPWFITHMDRIRLSAAFSAEAVYTGAMNGINRLSRLHTVALQSGNLQAYVLSTIAAALVLVAGTGLYLGVFEAPEGLTEAPLFEIGLGVIVLAAAVMAAVNRSRLAGVVALGVVGYGVALIYVLFGAPDLAMTQILVETLLVVLFVFIFARLPRVEGRAGGLLQTSHVVAAVIFGSVMAMLTWTVARMQTDPGVSSFYMENSLPAAFGRNVVNTILVDFRALDTLGEITVLAVAAIGVVALFRAGRGAS